jgi:hypothetical protein
MKTKFDAGSELGGDATLFPTTTTLGYDTFSIESGIDDRSFPYGKEIRGELGAFRACAWGRQFE